MSDPGTGRGLRNTLYKQVTLSGRRMTPGRRILYRLTAPLVAGIVRLWWRSCRIVAVVGQEHLEAVLAEHPSFLPVFWHQHQLMLARYLLQVKTTHEVRTGFLISPSLDGELGAMIIHRLGGYVIRGSSTHTGALAMKEVFQALIREQVSPVLTPDGPRGPRFKFKPGAVMLSQMSGRAMLPLAYAASRAWLVYWDKFVLPVPFCRIAVAIGPARTVARGGGAAGFEAVQAEMEATLKATYAAARAALEAEK